jgi:RNA polymerase sigma factor (sigma-70 family)
VRAQGVSQDQTDDIIQDVLLSVWQNLPGFEYDRSKGRFSSWLATITINKVKTRQVKNSRQSARDHKAYEQQEQSDQGDLNDMISREWAAFLTERSWELVKNEISKPMRKCFEGFMAGKMIRSIADELQIPENTVSVYKKRVSVIMKREINRLQSELD